MNKINKRNELEKKILNFDLIDEKNSREIESDKELSELLEKMKQIKAAALPDEEPPEALNSEILKTAEYESGFQHRKKQVKFWFRALGIAACFIIVSSAGIQTYYSRQKNISRKQKQSISSSRKNVQIQNTIKWENVELDDDFFNISTEMEALDVIFENKKADQA